MARSSKNILAAIVAPAVTLALLGGIVAEARTRVRPADAEPFHARAKEAISAFPAVVGDWVGRDTDIPPSATQLLRPNVILSRDYINQGSGQLSGQRAKLLIVQCSDARDLQGHYPPRCYPAHGDKQLRADPRTWQVGETRIPGMEYEFSLPNTAGSDVRQVVSNFFVIPHVPGIRARHPELDGAFCPDIEGVYASGEDYQRRYYGAAEFQLLTSPDLSQDQRDEIFRELIGANEPVLRTLMNKDADPRGSDSTRNGNDNQGAAAPVGDATGTAPVLAPAAMMTSPVAARPSRSTMTTTTTTEDTATALGGNRT